MVSLLLTVVLASAAQDSFDAKVSSPGLLTYPSVQRELKMTPQQIRDVAQAEAKYRDWARRTNDNNTEVEKKEVLRYLDAGQLKRLREISLQDSGPIVLMADFVAERIGADKAKRREIQNAFSAVVKEATKPMEAEISQMTNDVMRGISDPKVAEVRAREIDAKASRISAKYSADIDRAVQTKAPARMLAVLTPSQTQAWTNLLGRPFPVKDLNRKSAEKE